MHLYCRLTSDQAHFCREGCVTHTKSVTEIPKLTVNAEEKNLNLIQLEEFSIFNPIKVAVF